MLTERNSVQARARRAAYMREYGRKRGAVAVRGVMIDCVRCGKRTEKQNRAHDWCRDCVRPAQLERRRAKNAAKGAISIGTELICKNCSASFVKTNKRQFYCSSCSEPSEKEKLPSYKARINAYQKARNKRLYREDPVFAVNARMSALMRLSLKSGKSGRSWEALVGYTVTELMAHIERQFLKRMSWKNRDEWHIDHITPLKSFRYETTDDPEFKAAWALSNLRPMWGAENVRKSAKRTHLL
jgi:hypothetical protein